MANRILKPHQISINPEKVLIGNIELPSATQDVQVDEFDSTYSDDAHSSQNNLDRYIEQDDDSLAIEDLVELSDDELDSIAEEPAVAVPSHPSVQKEQEGARQPPIDTNDSVGAKQSTTLSATDSDASADRSDSADTDVEITSSVSDDELVTVNQQLQEALRALAETEQQLVALQREREEERAADLQQQEERQKEERQRAEEERQQIFDTAKQEGTEIVAAAHAEAAQIQQEAHDVGHKEGFDQGYEQVEPVIARLKEVTGKIVQKRQEILTSVEEQMVELVLLIARKVVKILAKENRQVVVENVRRALELVRKRGEVIIRINPKDLHLTAASLKKVIVAIEHDGKISFIEDGSIEEGGCLIETEFGEIDARIHSQMLALENKILT